MFVQVLRGHVPDAAAVRERLDSIVGRLSAEPGWLGTTAGVTDDGEFVALVRFGRDEPPAEGHGGWWSDLTELVEGELQVLESTAAGTYLDGGRDDAGFVQVMFARPGDIEHAIGMLATFQDELKRERPDLLGGVWCSDGKELVQSAFFRSEQEAREGEAKLAWDEGDPGAEQWSTALGTVTYLDLRRPWTFGPAQ